jgi:hypothetical protein
VESLAAQDPRSNNNLPGRGAREVEFRLKTCSGTHHCGVGNLGSFFQQFANPFHPCARDPFDIDLARASTSLTFDFGAP